MALHRYIKMGPIKVMFTCNLWTSKGLVNEAQGVVKKIWFDQGSNAHSHVGIFKVDYTDREV